MWRIVVILFAFLSADAQRFKIKDNENFRDGIETSQLEPFQDGLTYRLPNSTRPESYLIELVFGNFHENDMQFTGTVDIAIRVLEDTSTIVLHSAVIVTETRLTVDGGIVEHTRGSDSNREFLFITSSVILTPESEVNLMVNYRMTIGTSISGVYRGSYLSEENEIRWSDLTHVVGGIPRHFSLVCEKA